MKYVVVSAIIFSLLFGSYHLSKSRTYQLFAPIVSHVKTDKPVVALTFDDGPTATHAQTVLDVLSDKDIKATFFVTGRQTLENLDLAKAIVEAGHELGNHSFSHKRMIFKSPNFIRNEIEETDKAIRQAGHIGPIYFRPPYCKKLFILPWYLRQEKRVTVTVNLEPDTYERTAEGMVDYVNEGVSSGSIILLHVMYGVNQEARAALPLMIDSLKNAGYSFVTLSELLALN